MHTQAYIGGKHEGTDVQAGAVGMRNPVLIHLDQSLHGLLKILSGDGRNAHTIAAIHKAMGVAVGAEQLNVAVRGAIGLHALEQLLCIMEDHGSGIQFKAAVGDDSGVKPTLAFGVVHNEHMIGELFAEAQLGLVRRLLLGMSGFRNLDVQHTIKPLFLLPGPPLYQFHGVGV